MIWKESLLWARQATLDLLKELILNVLVRLG